MSSSNRQIDEQSLARARDTFQALRRPSLYSARHQLYGRRRLLLWRDYEPLWPFAEAWSAANTLASIHREDEELSAVLTSFGDGLSRYRRTPESSIRDLGNSASRTGSGPEPVGFECRPTPPLSGGGDRFYDDNAWVGLSLVRSHSLTGDDAYLFLAERVFEFVVSGWARDPTWPYPGGIRWEEPARCTSRNTCSNGPGAELACLLHLTSGSDSFLSWAKDIYEWVRSCLVSPHGMYFDRIAKDGSVAEEIYSYNQGTMLGTGLLLHRITGEERYLDEAVETAKASCEYFTLERLLAHDAPFNAVWLRNLFALDIRSYVPGYEDVARSYSDARWNNSRDRRTGLFPNSQSVLNETAAMVQIYALMAGAEPHP